MKIGYIVSLLVICTSPLIAKRACAKQGARIQLQEKKDSQNEKHMIVTHGQRFTITLPSNPSTGYDWHIQGELDTKRLRLIKETYKPATEKPGMVGVPGKKSFTFGAKARGQTKLILEYKRIWEDADPAEEKIYLIQVK